MIATGGLLRITARRQDSLKAKAHKEQTHKKKSKHKRSSQVVVVKGKLKLVSLSGLVAALGVLVLLVGMAMAALGYWPRHGRFFSTPGAQEQEEPSPPGGGGGRSPGGANGTSQQGPGLLTDLLNRYLYSDRLKVLGPLVMGTGIFLFICANAVLHEDRDRKSKVIQLRDIYSTAIDLQGRRQPSSSSSKPRLVNYVQSQSLEPRSRCYPPFLLSRGEGRAGGEGGGASSGGGVFSVDQYKPSAPSRSSAPPAAWRRCSAQDGGPDGGRGGGGRGRQEGLLSCSASRLHVEELLPSPLPVSAYRRCSLPAVAVATAPSHPQSCDAAETTPSPLWGGARQALTL